MNDFIIFKNNGKYKKSNLDNPIQVDSDALNFLCDVLFYFQGIKINEEIDKKLFSLWDDIMCLIHKVEGINNEK